jgi:5-methyltetrahydrofolate--homocysteine methyltransferase
MNTILHDLAERKVLVSDGAWGTFLVQKGMRPGECPELWNAEHRNAVLDIARSYVDSGSDIIGTNSFGGSRFKLCHFGLVERLAELNEAAAAISREAAGADKHVAASIGPTGKFLMTGEVSDEEMYDAFREQALALERGGADACCIETMAAIDEAILAVRAAKENTSLQVICTFTYNQIGEGQYRTMMGVSPTEMAAAILEAGADIIGANCGHGGKQMVGIVRELRAAAPAVPIMVQANAGMPVQTEQGVSYPETPAITAGWTPHLLDAGANIIGGCCGTTPAHVRAIRDEVSRYLSKGR